jgi:hypothetical protein
MCLKVDNGCNSNDGSYEIFFVKMILLQYLKTIRVYKNYIWLCDFIFFNTYIFFLELFMCKVLGFGFFTK